MTKRTIKNEKEVKRLYNVLYAKGTILEEPQFVVEGGGKPFDARKMRKLTQNVMQTLRTTLEESGVESKVADAYTGGFKVSHEDGIIRFELRGWEQASYELGWKPIPPNRNAGLGEYDGQAISMHDLVLKGAEKKVIPLHRLYTPGELASFLHSKIKAGELHASDTEASFQKHGSEYARHAFRSRNPLDDEPHTPTSKSRWSRNPLGGALPFERKQSEKASKGVHRFKGRVTRSFLTFRTMKRGDGKWVSAGRKPLGILSKVMSKTLKQHQK